MNLKALFVNCTLKSSPEISNTQALIDKAIKLFEEQGIECESVRFVDYNIAAGVSSDEGNGDEWPRLYEKIKICDIFIVGSPVWVGHTPSTTQRLIERLDSLFHEEKFWDKETGQYDTYNKVAGCIVTGNEDGAHSVVAQVLFAMQEFGFTIPAAANTYWVGKAGPGPSYIKACGERYGYTNKTVRFMVHNLLHLARLLKQHPYPTNLNQLTEEAKQVSDNK